MSEVYTRAFKLAAVARMEGSGNVSALAAELGVHRNLLYRWRRLWEAGGAAALRTVGRPRPGGPASDRAAAEAQGALAAARHRVEELERTVGRQALELDFFERALRAVEASRQPSDAAGETASTPSSRR